MGRARLMDAGESRSPAVTQFRVAVGRCRGRRRRVQDGTPSRPPTPWGRPAPSSGPRAMAWGSWLDYGLGLSFGKCSSLLDCLGIGVSAGAIASSSASTGTDLVPTHDAI